MKQLKKRIAEAELKTWLDIFFLLTVFTSFFSSYILSVAVPGIGSIYPFRVLLPVTAILYIVWAWREKRNFWKESGLIAKMCYILIAIMVVYSVVSLAFAIDFKWTFQRFFNLCFDLCFFFLFLHLCKEKKMLYRTLRVSAIAAGIIALMGVYEIFNGGIFSDKYDVGTWFSWFMEYYQFPLTVASTANEFAATLVFIFIPCVLFWMLKREYSFVEQLVLVVLIPFTWFLLLGSSGRLCQLSFCIFMAGLAVHYLFGKKKIIIPLIALGLVLGVQFAHQYRFIVPPVQAYVQELQKYKNQSSQVNVDAEQNSNAQNNPSQPPKLEIGDPKKLTLEEQFLEENEETGQKELKTNGSAAVRARLIIHMIDCIRESRGMGVGLGNTEMLARDRKTVDDGNVWVMHCFGLRLISDYGIFVLIPLLVIAILLIKQTWMLFVTGIREKNYWYATFAVTYFCGLVTFPFVSTASADMQDVMPMWIYLGAMVSLSGHLKEISRESV